MSKILFLHGLDARPGGVKPTWLARQGHDVLNPALPRDDFPASVRIGQSELDEYSPDVVVGSSRGGAVALAMELGDVPLIVLAPAWKFFVFEPHKPRRLRILHSPADSLIPIQHSRELVELWHDLDATLIEVGAEHSLNDEESLTRLNDSIRELTALDPRPCSDA